MQFRQKLPQEVDEKILFEVIKAGFSHRRKNLLNSLYSGFENKIEKDILKNILEEIGIEPTVRAEQLLMKDFIKISKYVASEFKSR